MVLTRLLRADAPSAAVLIRFVVGLVFVGVVEIVCGSLLLAGLATRIAAVPLILTMLVALASTKVPILLGHGYWIFTCSFAPKAGLRAFLHEPRTDLSMLCGSTFLAIVAADRWSIDRLLGARVDAPEGTPP